MMRTLFVVAGTVLAATAVSVPTALQCPEVAGAFATTGWHEYRSGRLDRARTAFTAALARCADHVDARLGLAYTDLRDGDLKAAGEGFAKVVEAQPENTDGWAGRGLVAWRTSDLAVAHESFSRALEIDPARADIREHLARLPDGFGPPPVRPPLELPDSTVLTARTRGDGFEVLTAAGWQSFYVRGVNLGAALPGRYPSQFPDSSVYRRWVADIAAMGTNTIRVYTLHPPAFYDAVAAHNRANPQSPLWLMHGVWAELPPADDYQDDAWKADFFADIEQVVDALHGRADVAPRPGRASGYYTSDVSPWILGLIIGREWEPFSVAEFNERSKVDAWRGRYLQIEGAPAMDAWLVEAMDHAVKYETETYRAQRPVAYTNWPTLDPMRHSAESNAHDELSIRGMEFDRSRRAHNEDEVSVSAHPRATAAYPAGWFAAYHVYPYFPDFLLHEARYQNARSPWGQSSYFGYLTELKQHYAGVPLLIAEYGVPASWGMAHFNPQGWHHGGHTEQAMAEINVRMTREIRAAGMAGSVLFSWIDEWFKHTWLDGPQEQPAGRNPLWWNRMNPEQHYGVNAVEPVLRLGRSFAARRSAWDTVAPLYTHPDGSALRAHADEAWLWLRISGPAARAERVMVGFDIADPASGQMRFPGSGAPMAPVGMEYMLEINGSDARVGVAPGVFPFGRITLPQGAAKTNVVSKVEQRPGSFFSGPYTQDVVKWSNTGALRDGRFAPQNAVVHRARIGSDSVQYLGMGYDRGTLRQGPLPDGAWQRDEATGEIEVRVPWTLIGVTDPSSLHVMRRDRVEQVDGIRVLLATQGSAGWRVLPASQRAADVALFKWAGWETPRFVERRRPVFEAMRAEFARMQEESTTQAAAR